MLQLYNFISYIAFLVYLPVLCLAKKSRIRKNYLRERLGFSQYESSDVWLHAVSVGEFFAALPFLNILAKEFPHLKITISVTTHTGWQMAHDKFTKAARIMYMPLDAGFIVARVVTHLQPKLFITMETEIWPNLIKSLKDHQTKILLLNGRVSSTSFRNYRKIKPLMRCVLSKMDLLGMQDATSHKRMCQLGAPLDRTVNLGNFKFDRKLKRKSMRWVKRFGSVVMTAGSTHAGEEQCLLAAFKIIQLQIPNLKLIIAPRHPERFDEVESLLRHQKIPYVRRSQLGNTEDPSKAIHCDVILLDTMGELACVYAVSTVVFVGGSLVPVGGHNIMEPAYWGKPIIVGKHLHNFPIAFEFINRNAAKMVTNENELADTVVQLVQDKNMADKMGQNARALLALNIGAVKRAINITRDLLPASLQQPVKTDPHISN